MKEQFQHFRMIYYGSLDIHMGNNTENTTYQSYKRKFFHVLNYKNNNIQSGH